MTMWIFVSLFGMALMVGAQSAPTSMAADLPAGSRAQIRLVDFVDSEHQPAGYTYRGVVEGDIAAGKIADKSRVLLRLVADPGAPGGLTLDWWAVKAGDDWSEFRGSGPALPFCALTGVDDRRKPSPESSPLLSRGSALYIPIGSSLHFEIRRPVRLLNVGSLRF